LVKNFPGATYHSAYEAGFSGFWTHNKLKEMGINSIVVNAADIPTTGKEKVQKEDARDSKKIARSLRSGELAPIYVPSPRSLEDRSLVRMRKTLVTDSTRAKNRIKSFLHFQGIDIPEALNSSKWTKRFLKWLEGMEMGQGSKQTLDAYMVSYYGIRSNILNVTKQIRGLSKSDAYQDNVGLLKSIPGIGIITSMTILTELETMERFGPLDKLCGFIGLIPSTNSSGDNDKAGDITPRGHSVLRSAIIESAWVAARVDPVLAKSYHEYCKRMDGNKAIIRIAKKLVGRIRYVLKNKKDYVCEAVK
jgi:transposase